VFDLIQVLPHFVMPWRSEYKQYSFNLSPNKNFEERKAKQISGSMFVQIKTFLSQAEPFDSRQSYRGLFPGFH
jgi:hypothetical protein